MRIHQRDHDPPHCHVVRDDGEFRVLLDTLETFFQEDASKLDRKIRKCLRKHQDDMIEAWSQVTVVPIGQTF